MINAMQNLISKSAQIYKKNPSNFLNVTTAVNFSILSLAEAVAISKNKDIPKEQKKFMVPQAISEGLINVGIILTVSTALRKLGSSLVKKAKVLPAELAENLINKNVITKIVEAKNYSDIADKKIANLSEDVFKKVKSFHNGMTVIAGPLMGLFLAQNVLNPILTNKFARFYRKRLNEKQNIKLDIKEAPIILAIKLSDDIKTPLSFASGVKKSNPYEFFANQSLYFNSYIKK